MRPPRAREAGSQFGLDFGVGDGAVLSTGGEDFVEEVAVVSGREANSKRARMTSAMPVLFHPPERSFTMGHTVGCVVSVIGNGKRMIHRRTWVVGVVCVLRQGGYEEAESGHWQTQDQRRETRQV